MPKRDNYSQEITRINARVPVSLAARVDAIRARLRGEGLVVSAGAIVEVALEEFLKQRDLAAILRRHGAKARRD